MVISMGLHVDVTALTVVILMAIAIRVVGDTSQLKRPFSSGNEHSLSQLTSTI